MSKLKPSFLFKQKIGGDVRFPSVCCDYHWLVKKLLWAYSGALGEQSLVGKTKLNAGKKKGRVREKPCSPPVVEQTFTW